MGVLRKLRRQGLRLDGVVHMVQSACLLLQLHVKRTALKRILPLIADQRPRLELHGLLRKEVNGREVLVNVVVLLDLDDAPPDGLALALLGVLLG